MQLRLFPAPKPLVERLGVDFFRRVPTTPGVYFMSDERERVLYIGKAKNLRQRLNSYRYIRPERASRKLVRLVHQVRSVVWETCACADSALLRENQLLRLHKPRFNVLNARPEHYRFIGVRQIGEALELRLTRETGRRHGETIHGAFKGLGRARGGFASLLRLLWIKEHQPATIHALPSSLTRERQPVQMNFNIVALDGLRIVELLRRFLDGHSDELLRQFTLVTVPGVETELCLARLCEQDLESLAHFQRFGPVRNRHLREHCAHPELVIAQDELDDLLVIAPPQPKPIAEAEAVLPEAEANSSSMPALRE